jgi:hypothetical protein
VQTTEASPSIESIQSRIAPLQHQLQNHPLYSAIRTLPQIRLFMQSHVFAVWDFMSLLKSLQRTLTSVEVPWVPTAFPQSRRFINEIVLGEETDQYQGRIVSHFELYLEAMEQAQADTRAIRHVVTLARTGTLNLDAAPPAAREFVASTFRIIRTGSPAAQAAAFAFGREDAIPEMFRAFVRHLSREHSGDLDLFVWYLERHIEVDGDDHGPLALSMVSDLCGNDPALWEEAAEAAEQALQARLCLWDSVHAEIIRLPSSSPVSS